MLSKFLRVSNRLRCEGLLMRKIRPSPAALNARWSGELIPPSQYDVPLPKRLNIGYVLKVYWETIPLFVVTCTALAILFFSIASACKNKVDVVFTTHNRENISRTMNLRNPTIHKLIIIHQRYEPWPEMQDVLDKMVTAQHRALVRVQSCSHA